jgi:glutathione synthase/RimK-type ligase-like ATP-grasp enzyme
LLAGLQLSQKPLTTFPDVVVVRVSTPSVQSDSEITILRHLEKLGCRLVNRPQSILNCINKFWTFQELAGHGVPMPDTFSYGESPENKLITPSQNTDVSLLSLRNLL